MNMITSQQEKYLLWAYEQPQFKDIIDRSLALKRRSKISHMTRSEAWECISVIKTKAIV